MKEMEQLLHNALNDTDKSKHEVIINHFTFTIAVLCLKCIALRERDPNLSIKTAISEWKGSFLSEVEKSIDSSNDEVLKGLAFITGKPDGEMKEEEKLKWREAIENFSTKIQDILLDK